MKAPLAVRASNGALERHLREVVLPYEGDECLIWPFCRGKDGYARLSGGKLVTRRVCEETNGPPPTPKHEAAHSCGRGHEACVTKRHLSWKTPKENSADKLLHGTHNRGERNPSSKITEDQARQILSAKGTATQREIADLFGVHQSLVSCIHNGKRWVWLQEGEAA